MRTAGDCEVERFRPAVLSYSYSGNSLPYELAKTLICSKCTRPESSRRSLHQQILYGGRGTPSVSWNGATVAFCRSAPLRYVLRGPPRFECTVHGTWKEARFQKKDPARWSAGLVED